MRELSFVGLSADGRHLLLVATDSSEYSLRVDDRLATALRRESDRLRGQPADLGPMPKNPSPREIQDRIRAGMSVGAIAAAAGVSESAISRFATAVLAERAHVAEQARRTLIRFQDTNLPLGDAVDQRLKAADIDVTELRWDAWRRHDGDWTIICAFPFNQGERVATFVFDQVARRTLPDDDDARWIIEQSGPDAATELAAGSATTTPDTTDAGEALVPPRVLPTGRNAAAGQSSSGAGRGWDSSHPAARAQQRRDRAESAAPQRDTLARRDVSSAPASSPANSPRTGPPRTNSPRTSGWEDLLLGSTNDYGDEESGRS